MKTGDRLKNGGIIVDVINGIVLARFEDKWVTWQADVVGNTWWGRYFDELPEAVDNLYERAGVKP